ncbi:MAG: HAMP domain-containing protein [Chloroflexi bacterium]|nr:HAMP domain-containing protein [Chloroflexota bacterium]
MFTSLRSRLIGVYVGLVIIGFGGLTLLAGRQIAINAYDDFGTNLHIHALLLATQLLEPVEHSSETAVSILQDSAYKLNAQVAIFTPAGKFWLSSDQQPAPFVQTDTYRVQLNSAGEKTIYVSAVISEGDDIRGIVQIGVPASIPQTAVTQRWLALGVGFFIFSLLGFGVSLWLLTTLTKPLARLEHTALQMAEGDLTQRVMPLSDDEIGHVGAAFNTMAERVEAMVTEQRAFTGNASHELRTPLTTIRLRTEWLQSGQLDEQTSRQYIGDIDSEARRMSRLVEDLLLLSRLDAKRLDAGEEQFDVGRLWQVLGREYEETAVSENITLVVHTPDTPLPPIQANLNHAQVVFRNLLDNAFKYTPSGGEVTVSVQQIERYIQVEVADTGRGIATAELPHIGKRFYRTDKARSRQTQGTGLGLSLVDSILQLYGGQLDISSAGVDKGTAVTVHWPVA